MCPACDGRGIAVDYGIAPDETCSPCRGLGYCSPCRGLGYRDKLADESKENSQMARMLAEPPEHARFVLDVRDLVEALERCKDSIAMQMGAKFIAHWAEPLAAVEEALKEKTECLNSRTTE